MTLPELIANPSTPGVPSALTTLASAMSDTTGTTATVAGAAPTPLARMGTSPYQGQFRILVDSEIMIVTAGAAGTSWTVVRGADGSTAATHSSGAQVWFIDTAEQLSALGDPTPGFKPFDAGLLLANFDPAFASSNAQASNGSVYVFKVWVPVTTTVANLLLHVQTAGATLTAAQNLAGIYDPTDGSLIAQTADQSGSWNSTGLKTMALTAQSGKSLTLPGGPGLWYWAALLAKGTTTPKFAMSPTSTLASIDPGRGATATVPGARYRAAFESVGGRTSLLSLNTLTLSALNLAFWVGLT